MPDRLNPRESIGPIRSRVPRNQVLLRAERINRKFEARESGFVQQLKTRIAGNSEDSMQSRVARRYPLTELVTFVCKGKGTPFSPIAGVTVNLSSTGILFLTEETVEVGSAISLTLYIPSRDAARTIMLRADGKVLRVEPAGEKNRVAAEIRFQDDLEGSFDATGSKQ